MAKLDQKTGEALAERSERGVTLPEAKKKLDRDEEKLESGIKPRMPKHQLLDNSKFSVIFPGRKARYVRIGDAAESRLADGWQHVSEEDARTAGKRTTLGTQYVLMWLPQTAVDQRQREIQEKNRRLLKASGAQFKADVAAAQRRLAADGVIDPSKSLLSDESDGQFDNRD